MCCRRLENTLQKLWTYVHGDVPNHNDNLTIVLNANNVTNRND